MSTAGHQISKSAAKTNTAPPQALVASSVAIISVSADSGDARDVEDDDDDDDDDDYIEEERYCNDNADYKQGLDSINRNIERVKKSSFNEKGDINSDDEFMKNRWDVFERADSTMNAMIIKRLDRIKKRIRGTKHNGAGVDDWEEDDWWNNSNLVDDFDSSDGDGDDDDDDDNFDDYDDDDDDDGEGCIRKFCYNMYADFDSNDEDEYEYTSRFKARVIKSLNDERDKDEDEKKNLEDDAISWSATRKKLRFFDDSE